MCGALIEKCAIKCQYFVGLNYLQQDLTQDGPHFQDFTAVSTKMLKLLVIFNRQAEK